MSTNPPPTPEASAAAATEPTPRQRMLAALRCEPTDRVPAWLMRQAGRYLPQYHEVRRNYDFLEMCKTPEAAAEVSIQPLEAIGSDAIIIFNDIMLPLEHAGADVGFDEKGPFIGNPVRWEGDLARLKPHPVQGCDEPIAATIAEARRRVGPDIPILGFVGAPWTLATYWIEGRLGRRFDKVGPLRFADPHFLDMLLDHITQYVADYLELQIDAGADAVQIFDTWASLLNPAEFLRFSAPRIRVLTQCARDRGVPVIVYAGGSSALLEPLATLGADALSLDWRVDLAKAREVLGEGVALQGNLDPLALLAPPEAVERAVRELFERFPPGPGHVFNLGHGVLPATPVESARAALEAVKRHGRY